MFYILSKVFWTFAQPLNAAILLVLLSLIAAIMRWRRLGVALGLGAFLILFLSAWTTLGALMLHPLEDRFSRPGPAPAAVAGIIVLGGGFEGGVNRVRGGYELNASGDRFVETAILARRYPSARVVVTGGSGSLMLEGEADADTAPRLLEALGVARERMVLEDRSRNTAENASFTRALVEPVQGETWLLVTSAFHMPRAVALFRKAGFAVTAWPADYRTSGAERLGLAEDNIHDSLQNTTLAIREWIGLAAYRLTGRIDEILPSPR